MNAYITGDGTFDLIDFTPTILEKGNSLELVLRFSTIMVHNGGVAPSQGIKNATLTLVTDQNAAFGEQGDIFTFDLTGVVVPEISNFYLLSLAFLLFPLIQRHFKNS